jgi:hypothetical protein
MHLIIYFGVITTLLTRRTTGRFDITPPVYRRLGPPLLYTADIVNTTFRKFTYADDVDFIAQGTTMSEVESTLDKDIVKLQKYFKTWYLTLNDCKSTAIAFHLNNREASTKLQIMVNGTRIPNDNFPRYLGVKLDRTLTFKKHLDALKDKLKMRNNIIFKLAGTGWGCKANTLRTSAQ